MVMCSINFETIVYRICRHSYVGFVCFSTHFKPESTTFEKDFKGKHVKKH